MTINASRPFRRPAPSVALRCAGAGVNACRNATIDELPPPPPAAGWADDGGGCPAVDAGEQSWKTEYPRRGVATIIV